MRRTRWLGYGIRMRRCLVLHASIVAALTGRRKTHTASSDRQRLPQSGTGRREQTGLISPASCHDVRVYWFRSLPKSCVVLSCGERSTELRHVCRRWTSSTSHRRTGVGHRADQQEAPRYGPAARRAWNHGVQPPATSGPQRTFSSASRAPAHLRAPGTGADDRVRLYRGHQ